MTLRKAATATGRSGSNYVLLFDVEDEKAREGAAPLRKESDLLDRIIANTWGDPDARFGRRRQAQVRVCSSGTPAEGEICGRAAEPPPRRYIDVTEIPSEKPSSNVPLVEKDGYWLTPIEVPFYDALRDTSAIFAVQPWVQGVERRYRPDFGIFYDGGTIVVELDGPDSHKTREQRTSDARRQRWLEKRGIRVLRWTGSEVLANAQECVRELLEILRGKQARF